MRFPTAHAIGYFLTPFGLDASEESMAGGASGGPDGTGGDSLSGGETLPRASRTTVAFFIPDPPRESQVSGRQECGGKPELRDVSGNSKTFRGQCTPGKRAVFPIHSRQDCLIASLESIYELR